MKNILKMRSNRILSLLYSFYSTVTTTSLQGSWFWLYFIWMGYEWIVYIISFLFILIGLILSNFYDCYNFYLFFLCNSYCFSMECVLHRIPLRRCFSIHGKPKKSLGQHFLKDKNVLQKILQYSNISFYSSILNKILNNTFKIMI